MSHAVDAGFSKTKTTYVSADARGGHPKIELETMLSALQVAAPAAGTKRTPAKAGKQGKQKA